MYTDVNEIPMISPVLIIAAIKKRSQAKLFKDLKVGNRIQMTTTCQGSGRGSNGIYAKMMTVRNLDTNATTEVTFNEIDSRLAAFAYTFSPYI